MGEQMKFDWGYELSLVSSARHIQLVNEQSLTDTQARNSIIADFLACAAGEACRIARSEGREPDEFLWMAAAQRAFRDANIRTKAKDEEAKP